MALCRRFRSVKKNTRRVAWPVLQSRCKALSALSQNTLKNTKTGRKSVGFLILTQAPKCTRFHCFPPQKHPKNGFVMRFAGKNSFFQLRARDFSFYMNAYIKPMRAGASACAAHTRGRASGRLKVIITRTAQSLHAAVNFTQKGGTGISRAARTGLSRFQIYPAGF